VWRPELPPQIARSSGEFYRGAHAFQLLWSKDTRRWLVVLCLYKSGEYMAMPMLRPMLVDQHHTIEELAYLIGTVGFGAGLLGALVGGYFVKLFGHGAALRWFLIGNSISLLAYAEIAAFPLQSRWLLLACAIEHFSGGMATVALFTEMMYHCRANCEATDYTLQSCLTIVVSVSMASLSGFIAKAVGYPALFLLCSIWTLAIFPLVLWYQRRRDQMETQAQVRR
jgi:predicted MFS family arabinose efflux permease